MIIAGHLKRIKTRRRDAPWFLCANRSSFSSPISNRRPPAVGVSLQSLIMQGGARRLHKKCKYHIPWILSLSGSSGRDRCSMNSRTILKSERSPDPKPLESCRTRNLFGSDMYSRWISASLSIWSTCYNKMFSIVACAQSDKILPWRHYQIHG